MKIRIEVNRDLVEDEVLIRCKQMNDSVQKISRLIFEQAKSEQKITFYKQNREFYFPLKDILFFETTGDHVYAHTTSDAYQVKYRLYELENILPLFFARASKSTIINVCRVYSVTRSLTSSSLVSFAKSHKQIYASRYYYKELQRRLQERSSYET